MRSIVGFFQSFRRNVSVNLGRREVGMAEQFLDAPQIRAGIEQMRCIAVAQLVRRQMRIQAGDRQILFQSP